MLPDLAEQVLRICREAGFARAGIASLEPIQRGAYLTGWLQAGFHGEMAYLERWRELRLEPARLLEGAKTAIVVADVYRLPASPQGPSADEGTPRARVARYAWGRDYHRIVKRKLRRVVDQLRAIVREPFETRICVDTAPILERELAHRAGVGWIGKNTLVLHHTIGSYFFLGEILTTLDLVPTPPAVDHCGTCTRCLDACPTGALIAPYQMDARRCISYLTIEHRSEIPGSVRPLMGDWLYGCDICQEVCPHNMKAVPEPEPAYQPTGVNPLVPTADPRAVLGWSEAEYAAHLAGSAMKRARLDMLQRNARIVLENISRAASETSRASIRARSASECPNSVMSNE